jgi:alkylation response protein AidB-like acyl-CoA dehydrogenase
VDLEFPPAERAFRDAVREFLRGALPATVRAQLEQGAAPGKDEIVAFQRALNARGWAVPHWPPEWGGTRWSAIEHHIFQDELQQWPAPAPLPFNVDMVGPVIAAFGSDAQKRRFLPRAANLDDWWCQGFSEPGAGSDLASLRTSATRAGDHYRVSGHKIWTTYAQYADWIFCLVRTHAGAKKQEGISFLLIDMKSKGITLRPILTFDGAHEINEVLLDNVEVPPENLVGVEGRGWEYAKFLLSRERSTIARVGSSKQLVRQIRRQAGAARHGAGTLLDEVGFRERLAVIELELKALEITELRVVAAAQRTGGRPDPLTSLLKIRGSEIQQALSELLLEACGPDAMRAAAEPAKGVAPGVARAAPRYFNWRKLSIYGGSNEIQRNIIAKAILGL